ncbi:MAG: GNAT family N-acetyltransferase [Planctomyces sp.]
MSPLYYAEFLERMGHTVRESNGVYWYNVLHRAWICFPLEKELNPAEISLSDVMDHRGIMARYCTRVEDGVPSFRQVISDKNYTLSSLCPKTRNQTRQGLQNCTCGPEDARAIATDGITLHTETLRRQGRRVATNYESYWRKYFDAVAQCPSATVWAARHQGVLASFLISFRIEGVENIFIVRSREESLKYRPNNAMLFTFLQHALQREETTEVCIGLQSLQNGMNSLDSFKRGMGFEERAIGQRIELRSTIGLSVPRPLAKFVGKAAEHLPGEYAARLAGALSLYAHQPVIRRAA